MPAWKRSFARALWLLLSAGFILAAEAANTPPTIGQIPNQTTFVDQPTHAIALPINDAETAKVDLRMTATSSDQSVVPNANIFFGTFSPNQYITVTPAFGRTSGTATITVNVSDGTNSASTNFLFTVNPPPAGWSRFANTNAVTIPLSGTASPYPSTINVSGMSGTITNLELTLSKLSHQFITEVDMLLVSPSGQEVMVMSHIAEGRSVSNITVTLTDSSAYPLPQSFDLWPEPLRPTDWVGTNVLPAPAPARPYGATAFSTFNGLSANGNWTLYINDNFSPDQGVISGGWSLLIATTGGSASGPTISDIPNQTTISNVPTAAIPFLITDPDTPLASLVLTKGSSNPALVPTNNIVFGGSGSNRTVTVTPAGGQLGSATITVTVSDGTNSASDNFLLTVTPTNTAPTITGVGNQSTPEDTPTAALPFTIGDSDTPADSLTLTRASSNTSLVPTNNIVFGGSGSNRTVTVTPAPNLSGSATITITVSDGALSRSTNFVLTVTPVNDAPVISDLTNLTILVSNATPAIPFTIGDVETAATSLTLAAGSSNPALVPTNNIVFGGSGSNRTVTVTPVLGQTGQATIFVTVRDGTNNTTDTFVLTVSPPGGPNNPPTIGQIPDQGTIIDQPTYPFLLPINDTETAKVDLRMTATSSDQSVVPNANIFFGTFSPNQYITVTPAFGRASGTATITVNVSDGTNTASTNFLFTVNPAPPGRSRFANTNAINIPDVGVASPYPSTINVSGMSGTITNLELTLSRFSHQFVPNVDLLLVSPSGTAVMLMSGVSEGRSATNLTLTLTDGSPYPLPFSFDLWPEPLQPTDWIGTNVLPSPAPPRPYGATVMSTFNGLSANGNWTLYAYDRFTLATGAIAGGWSLLLGTTGGNSSAPSISDITNRTTVMNTATPAMPFTIGDPDTPAPSLTLIRNSSNPTLVPTNNIVFGGSGSNRTVTVTPANGQVGAATITVTVSDGTNSASDSFVLTVVPPNTPPSISAISNQSTPEDTLTSPIAFTIGDTDTPADGLTLGRASSNAALVPTNNIVFGGSGSNRTVTITPATNASGAATITVSVSDGVFTTTTNFVLTVTAVNDVPVLSDIPDQATSADSPTVPFPFTVGDVETPAGSLALSADSSNPGLLPTNGVVFGGSGSNRTVSVAPSVGQTGNGIIFVSLSDGTNTVVDSFLVTVNPPGANLPPSITDVPDQTVDEDTVVGPLGFSIGDPETPAGSLSVFRSSTNPSLVPTNNIVLGGSGASRTVTVTPIANASGSTIITLTVSDGTNTASDTFAFTVNDVNDAPTITGFPNQSTITSVPIGPLNFTIGDVETAVESLVLAVDSSDLTLVPAENIVLGGSGSNRSLTITPVAGLSGASTITLSVNDGAVTTATNFLVTVAPVIVSNTSFTNGAMLTLSNAAPGPASLYPSTINVSGVPGLVTNVTVQLRNITHAWTRDIDVVLVAPNGRAVTLMSDAGNGGANGVTLTLSDAAPSSVPQTALTAGTFRPGDYTPADSYPFPGPGAPFYNALSAFRNQGANGAWSLYVVDDGQNDLGRITDGWTLTLTTISDTLQAPAISGVSNVTILEETTTGPLEFTIGDPDTDVSALQVTAISSHPALVPTNNIVLGGSGSNRTVTVTPLTNAAGPVIIWLTVSDGTNAASTNFTVTITDLNDPPTISAISNRSVNEDVSTGPINFTIADPETAAGSLLLFKASSNEELVPTNNIVLAGSGGGRTVTVTPAANLSGVAIITLTVSDGVFYATNSFTLTVNLVNDAPIISGVAPQVIDEDGATGVLPFAVGDVETEAANLLVGKDSSNPVLVPVGNITLGGADSNRTVQVTPAPGQSGAATITLSVNDGTNTTTTNFLLTVNPVNDAPSITAVPNQAIPEGGTAGPLAFTIGDDETPAADLVLAGFSSHPDLVPETNIVFGGVGASRTVTITPVAGTNGTATITLSVSDGTNVVNTNFLLTVVASNLAPDISAIGDMTVAEDNATPPIVFTVNDPDTLVGDLVVTVGSSNPSLLATNGILLGGADFIRSLVLTPATNASGSSTITVTVSDGTNSTSRDFVLNVTPVNDLPLITAPADEVILTNTATGALAFTVGDVESEAGTLTVEGASSNPGLVPSNNIVLGGSDSNRTVTITPAADASGSATITLSVSDGTNSVSTNFVLTVTTGPKLTFLGFDTNGFGRLQVEVLPQHTYAILGGSSISNWTLLGTVQSTNHVALFLDTNAPATRWQFYRARKEP